jgi:hypothetical protein
MLARRQDRHPDVLGAGGLDHHRGPGVDRAVPRQPDAVTAAVSRDEPLAVHGPAELVQELT